MGWWVGGVVGRRGGGRQRERADVLEESKKDLALSGIRTPNDQAHSLVSITDVFEANKIPVPNCPPQIPQRMNRHLAKVSGLRTCKQQPQ